MSVRSTNEGDDTEVGAVRCFVALLLDTAVRDELLAVQKLLRSRVAEGLVRWAQLGQLHLTLRFLGGVASSDLTVLGQRLSEAGAGHGPFRLELGGLGVFPEPRRPRVLWVGLGGDLPALLALQREVESAVCGFAPEGETRPFHPHLTLGRVGFGARAAEEVGKAFAAVETIQRIPWTVREMHLMRSELRPEGARYTVVSTAPLSSGRGDGSAVGVGMRLGQHDAERA